MNKHTYLFLLTLAGPAAEPSIDFPRWILLVLIGVMTGLAVLLSERYWFPFVIAAVIGAFSGMSSGLLLFPSGDGIAESYAPIAIGIGTALVIFVSLFSGLAARRIAVFFEESGTYCVACISLLCGIWPRRIGTDITLSRARPFKSVRGLWSDLGIRLSTEEIEENQREMWKNFPRGDV